MLGTPFQEGGDIEQVLVVGLFDVRVADVDPLDAELLDLGPDRLGGVDGVGGVVGVIRRLFATGTRDAVLFTVEPDRDGRGKKCHVGSP